MKVMVKYAVILGLICLVASSLLAGVNSLTKAKIIASAKEGEESSLKEIAAEGARFEPVEHQGNIFYYKVYDKDGNLSAFIFKALGKGYSSNIETMVGIKKDGTITRIKILSQNETPGLGTRVSEPIFTERFNNKNFQKLEEIEAITGATISSTAVINSIRAKVEEMKAVIENEF